jgi:predicted HTH domain antitoxin
MCKAFEEVKNEVREEMRLDFAKKLLAYGKMTLEEISQMTDLSVNDLRKLQEAGA